MDREKEDRWSERGIKGLTEKGGCLQKQGVLSAKTRRPPEECEAVAKQLIEGT